MNYFIVDTSFQMLCAIEAREAMAHGQVNRLLIEARGANEGRELNLEQIIALDDGKWASIDISAYPRYRGFRRSLARLWELLRIRRKYGRADCCISGLYSNVWAKRIAHILSGDRLIRLDDGTATITELQALRADGLHKYRFPVAFSIFYKPGDAPAIQQNTFKVLRGHAVEGYIDPTLVWLVGGAYAEAGLLEIEREVSILQSLASSARDRSVLYLPHRADREEKLARLGALGIRVAAFGPTFETRLLSSKNRPARICGIASTALLTGRLLSPESTVCAVRLSPTPNRAYDVFADQAETMGLIVLTEDCVLSNQIEIDLV